MELYPNLGSWLTAEGCGAWCQTLQGDATLMSQPSPTAVAALAPVSKVTLVVRAIDELRLQAAQASELSAAAAPTAAELVTTEPVPAPAGSSSTHYGGFRRGFSMVTAARP